MFKKSKVPKEEEKHALNIMVDFVEGRMTTEEFWNKYKDSIVLQKILVNDKTRPLGVYKTNPQTGEVYYDKKTPTDSLYFFAPEKLLDILDISKLEHRFELYEIIRRYFWRRKENLKFTNKDADEYAFLLKMLPEYLDIRDETFLYQIINSASEGFSKTEKLHYGQKKVMELFKYDKKPPDWIQSPEWPIVKGKPLVFRYQITNKENSDHEYYYFYDPETKEETIIEQYD